MNRLRMPRFYALAAVALAVAVMAAGASAVPRAVASAFRSPATSADGRCTAFTSSATNLVPNDTNGSTDIFVRDRGDP